MEKEPGIILVQLLKNEAATLALAKSLMTEEKYQEYLDIYGDQYKETVETFKKWFPREDE